MQRRRSRILAAAALALLLVLLAYGAWRRPAYAVVPCAETAPVRNSGDAADDPAVWVDEEAPERSLILGTDKKGGLHVFDLEGRELQYLEVGKLNNVDVRASFPFAAGAAPIAAATNKSTDSIDVFRIDPVTRTVEPAFTVPAPDGVDPDGFCLYQSPLSNETYGIVTTKDGRMLQFRLRPDGGEVVREVVLGSECEGCVADDELRRLYVSEENVGIWRLGAEPEDGDERVLVDRVRPLGRLRHDVEGLAIYREPLGQGVLLVSSQGSDDFLGYERAGDNDCLGRFEVVAGDGIDHVDHTDGIEAVSSPLGERFPRGVLIVQDDENFDGDEELNQNFKIIGWEKVEAALQRIF